MTRAAINPKSVSQEFLGFDDNIISETLESLIFWISASRHLNSPPFVVQLAMFVDKIGGVGPVDHVGWDVVTQHTDVNVVANFEMQVCWIHSEISADGADLLATFDGLAFFD